MTWLVGLGFAAACGCGSETPSEVEENLRAIFSGAEAYYEAVHTPPSSEPLTERFPEPNVGPTPALGYCCFEGGACSPRAQSWTDPVWDALSFSVSTSHYYVYQYEVTSNPEAKDGSNHFTAIAYGDLDCDSVFSTFMLTGVAEESGIVPSDIEAHMPGE